MTNTRTIEGIRLIARDTQNIKIFDKIGYAINGNHAVMELLNEALDYQSHHEHEFNIFENACIDFGKIDLEDLRNQAEETAEKTSKDEDEAFYDLFCETIEKVNPPHSEIMYHIKNEIEYYHEIQLYDGEDWFDESEIDSIDYDDGKLGTFTLKNE